LKNGAKTNRALMPQWITTVWGDEMAVFQSLFSPLIPDLQASWQPWCCSAKLAIAFAAAMLPPLGIGASLGASRG
jgi:hypothetical protein